jgi:hypothetical protein
MTLVDLKDMENPRAIGPLRFIVRPGMCWVAWGARRIFKIKNMRKAETALFSDRYASWHIGPYAVSFFRWPGIRDVKSS